MKQRFYVDSDGGLQQRGRSLLACIPWDIRDKKIEVSTTRPEKTSMILFKLPDFAPDWGWGQYYDGTSTRIILCKRGVTRIFKCTRLPRRLYVTIL